MTGPSQGANPRDWRSRAACRTTDPELFFPTAERGPEYDRQVARAKAVCAVCPVRTACLTDALARIPHGVAGGLDEQERNALSRQQRTVAAGQNTVKVDLTATGRTRNEPATAARVVENAEFVAFGRRVVRAAGRRVVAGDVDALPGLAALSFEVDAAITTAVNGLRGAGYSWEEIATRLGVTRQAAHQRWAGSIDRAGSTRRAVAS